MRATGDGANWIDEVGTAKSKPSLDRLATGHPTLTSALRDRLVLQQQQSLGEGRGYPVLRYNRGTTEAAGAGWFYCLRLPLFGVACAFAGWAVAPKFDPATRQRSSHPRVPSSTGTHLSRRQAIIINTAPDPSLPPSPLGTIVCSLVWIVNAPSELVVARLELCVNYSCSRRYSTPTLPCIKRQLHPQPRPRSSPWRRRMSATAPLPMAHRLAAIRSSRNHL